MIVSTLIARYVTEVYQGSTLCDRLAIGGQGCGSKNSYILVPPWKSQSIGENPTPGRDVGDEPVFEGESLTRTQVQEVAGMASSPMRTTRSQTQSKGKELAKKKGKGKKVKVHTKGRKMHFTGDKGRRSLCGGGG
ncbi:hypothetical protein AMTR_s00021p00023070 [Amborella trichopoda]|uniref:Uncharacterized protein n=1 Tax=Amborella trichopoda TaxID=13333 RepID=W1PV13_AMBTC|nr:hypothetical protein AMTR_s00021p00023070 [Amborella trichopoda]